MTHAIEYGEFRSVLAARDWAEAWSVATALNHPGEARLAQREWWRVADLSEVAKRATWHHPTKPDHGNIYTHNSLWWIDEEEWELRIENVSIFRHKQLDLQPIQHRWSTKPAWDVLHVWEESNFTKEHPEYFYAPRRALEVKDAWCRGDATDPELRTAANEAASAAWDCSDVLPYVAEVAYVAEAAADSTSNAAAIATAIAAKAKTYTLTKVERDEARQEYCYQFAEVVLRAYKTQERT